MPRDREHLALPDWGEPGVRRRRQPPPRPASRNRGEAGRQLLAQTEDLLNQLQEKQRSYPEGFNPANIFRLDLEAEGDLDEATLGRSGLRLLAKDPHRALVVVTDDVRLMAFRDRLRSYTGQIPGGAEYAELDVVRSITPLSSQDRTGRRLVAEPLQSAQEAPFDIELWHTGRRSDCERFLSTVQAVLDRHGIRLSDRWIGSSLCVCRARLHDAALRELLEMPEVKEVDRPPRPAFEHSELFQANVSDMAITPHAAPDLIGIVVVDSGVASQHPLIAPALGDAQVFPDALSRRVLDGPSDSTPRGHGTGVCGIAAYGDVLAAFRARRFVPSARVFSARVTDDTNEYDEEILLEHQLEQAIEYFLSNYPTARVINISLGDRNQVYADGYQTRFAAAIDDLAYRNAERGILMVVSSGNYDVPLPPAQVQQLYPFYLSQPAARLIEPATAALALTVGGLALGPEANRHYESDVQLPVAGDAGFPSPFTRVGPGVDGAIKPEVMEVAGDWILDRDRLTESGVVTLGKNFAGGALLVSRIGTSFAAPKVANTAAQLMRRYPDYSSNLIRALVVHSAEVPGNRPGFWSVAKPTNEEVLKVYGYGQPDLDRAIAAAQNEPWLLYDGRIDGDAFRIFHLPELPEEFLARSGRRRLKVTLAFDPPTRPTRKDSYLGFTMEFALYRNVDAKTLGDAYRKWDRQEKEELEDGAPPGRTDLNRCNLKMMPGSTRRKGGTVQSAWLEISRQNWKYEPGTPLFLVVVCERRWAPMEITDQRFAVVMSISHEAADVDLHARLQQRVGLFVRQRARV